MRGREEGPKQPDPLEPEVVLAYEANRRAYGACKIKAALERRGFRASRRRIGRIMKQNGLVSAYAKAKFKAHAGKVNEADLPNIVAREFDGRAPYPYRVGSDLRAGRRQMALHLPPHRPLQSRDRRARGRRAQGCAPREVGLRHGAVPPDRHPGLPHRSRRGIRRHRHRRPARGLRDRAGRCRRRDALTTARWTSPRTRC